jgi:hypothetical protein
MTPLPICGITARLIISERMAAFFTEPDALGIWLTDDAVWVLVLGHFSTSPIGSPTSRVDAVVQCVGHR